jgi:hypothetical protein
VTEENKGAATGLLHRFETRLISPTFDGEGLGVGRAFSTPASSTSPLRPFSSSPSSSSPSPLSVDPLSVA